MRIAPAVRNTSEEQWKEMREGINKRRRLKKEGRKAEGAPASSILHGQMKSGADRMRVTYVDRSVVLHWFDEEKVPEGRVIKNVLVVPGAHCRINNISLEKPYRWLKDEEFYVDGELVRHEAGQEVGGVLMKEWLEIREESPEWFAETTVMQQPRAVRDEIIIKWCQEELKELLDEKPILQQHDLLGTQWTKATRENAWALDIFRTVVPAQMTPLLQLADVRDTLTMDEIDKLEILRLLYNDIWISKGESGGGR